jgi:VanZ like family
VTAPTPGPPRGALPREGWHSWFGTYEGVVLVVVAALPIAALAVWVLVRQRRLIGSTPARAWRRSLAEVGIVYGTVPGVWVTLLPGVRSGVSLVPLRDLGTMSNFQIAGNLVIFAAFGFLAPLRFSALASVPRILVVAAAGSILIETAQHVLRLERVSSVDDVLLNAAGTGLAALASRPWWRAAPVVVSGERGSWAPAVAAPRSTPGSRS